MRSISALLAAACLFALAGQAAAAPWLQAETDRFIIRGEVSERTLRDYATRLSTFDAVLRAQYPHATTGRAPQKLHVYLVDGVGDMRAISPHASALLGGFFAPRPMEPFAVANIGIRDELDEVVLFHEYAHYFLRAYLPGAIPAWLNEGWAEYYGATKIEGDKVVVGGNSRGGALFSFWLPMEAVLSKPPGAFDFSEINRYYAQSWIFVHYMQATPERTQQLGRMIDLIGQGQSSVAALKTITGTSPDDLARQLQAYKTITAFSFDNPLKTPPTVTITKLPPAADALQFDWLHALRGCVGEEGFIERVRGKAARFPDDAFAQRILAQAEFACGDPNAGETIVDRLLVKDPNDLDTLRIGALNLAYAAGPNIARRAELMQKARGFAARGYALNQADAPLLYAYVFARRVQPGYPTANDVASIRTAMALSPAVGQITLLGGEVLMRSGQRAEGHALLMEVANDPHGGALAAAAQRLLARNATDVGEAIGKPAEQPETPD